MKPPPFLLFAALVFWGWEANLLFAGILAGAALELPRVVKFRLSLGDTDFNRIWSLCVLIIVVLFSFIFTTNDSGGGLGGMTHGPAAVRNATVSSSVAAYAVFHWAPLICFPLLAAQVFNVRPTVPLTAVSMVLRIRRRRGEQSLAGRYVDIAYAYFILCIFSAGIHPERTTYAGTYGYFGGETVLILWALWARRSARFGPGIWAAGLATVLVLGVCGLLGVNEAMAVAQKLDARLLARFLHNRTDPTQTMTAIGQIGELKLSPRIVIRLQPAQPGVAPQYLREASYCRYNSFNESWFARGTNFSLAPLQADDTTCILVPARTARNSINIACYLEGHAEDSPEGVLPLPSGTCRLENLPAFCSVQTNQTGVALATGPGLMIFDALYGPGATMDSLPSTNSGLYSDLHVPTNEIPAVDKVVAGLNLGRGSDLDKRLAVQSFFERNFRYSTWHGPEKRDAATPLTRFLLTDRSGHCEYFATATVLLMRRLGVPARYAVGYSVHETSGSRYVVRERDAHAWCLVWNRQTGNWEDFDTTPSSWVAIEGRNSLLPDFFSDASSWLVFQFEKFLWRHTDLRRYVLWTLTPVMAVLAYYILFQRRSKARASRTENTAATVAWPGLDSAFYRVETSLAARGLPRQPQQPLSDWLESALEEPALAGLRLPLKDLLRLHYRHRFDPTGLDAAERSNLAQNAEAILAELASIKARQNDSPPPPGRKSAAR